MKLTCRSYEFAGRTHSDQVQHDSHVDSVLGTQRPGKERVRTPSPGHEEGLQTRPVSFDSGDDDIQITGHQRYDQSETDADDRTGRDRRKGRDRQRETFKGRRNRRHRSIDSRDSIELDSPSVSIICPCTFRHILRRLILPRNLDLYVYA